MTAMPGNPYIHDAPNEPADMLAAVAYELRTATLLKIIQMGLITPESQDAAIEEIALRLGKEAKTVD